MSENEMRQEIDRLRGELADIRADRDRLHKTLCRVLPFEPVEITPEQLAEIARRARPVQEALRDLFPVESHRFILNATITDA